MSDFKDFDRGTDGWENLSSAEKAAQLESQAVKEYPEGYVINGHADPERNGYFMQLGVNYPDEMAHALRKYFLPVDGQLAEEAY